MSALTRVPLGDLVLDVLDLGPHDGPVVVLLHGFPQNAGEWRAVWPELVAAGYRVVVPDQRGYSPGARPEGVEPYALDLLVGDVVGLLDALGVPQAHLVGHDWGAAVGWQVAARHPDRVTTFTAVSVPHPVAFGAALRSDPDQRERSRYMLMFTQPDAEERVLADDAAWIRRALQPLPDEVADPYVQRMQEPGALTAALGWYRAQYAVKSGPVGSVGVPVLYVWSDEDAALGPVAAHATASYVDGPYRFEVLHGVSHWIPEQAPEQLTALLLEQLALAGRRPLA